MGVCEKESIVEHRYLLCVHYTLYTGVSSYDRVNSELYEMHFLVPLYIFERIFFGIQNFGFWSSKNGSKGGT